MSAYQELVLRLNSALLWKSQWHSTAILAGSSIVFTIIWLCNPNLMSIIAFLGIIATLLDYFLPSLLEFLFRSQVWTDEKQEEYEGICAKVILCKAKIQLFVTSYYRMRATNPKMYFIVTVIILCILTRLGGTVDNVFLTYIITTFFLMLPGMQYHGMLDPITKALTPLFNRLVQNAKVEPKKD